MVTPLLLAVVGVTIALAIKLATWEDDVPAEGTPKESDEDGTGLSVKAFAVVAVGLALFFIYPRHTYELVAVVEGVKVEAYEANAFVVHTDKGTFRISNSHQDTLKVDGGGTKRIDQSRMQRLLWVGSCYRFYVGTAGFDSTPFLVDLDKTGCPGAY